MADTVIAAQLTVDGSQASQQVQQVNKNLTDAGNTVKSFREQLKTAREELTTAIQNYGQFSTQAQDAAKKLGELQNTARDAQEAANNFATDGSAKLAAFGNAVRGVAGGFAAVQGAMALFGSESEDLQKTLVKVQAALALSEGLNSIGSITKSWQQFGTVIKSTSIVQGAYNWVMTGTVAVTEAETAATVQATAAAIAFRAALLFLTGGAIVAGIIAVVVALNSTSQAAEDAARKQKAYNDSVTEAGSAYKDAYTQVAKLRQEFAAAAGNTDLQKKALEDFNKSIGDSTKLQKTFNDAQAWLADDANTQAYVNAMLQRATATAAIGKAADASLKVQQGYQQIDQLAQTVNGKISGPIVQDAIAYLKKSGDITGAANELQKAIDKLSTKSNNEAGDYNAFPIVRDMIGILNSIKEAKTSVEDFTEISKNQTDAYNKYMTEHGYHEGNSADAEAVKKTLDDLLKKQMDNLASMQKAAEHDADVSQANEAEKTNIQVIAQEARISLLKSHLDKARAIGGDYYANYLQQEKQAELDLLALRDNYNKQLETQADVANAGELSRASKFRDNLKLVWTTGPNAGQEATQPIGTDNGQLKTKTIGDFSAQNKDFTDENKNRKDVLDLNKEGLTAQLDQLKDFYDQKKMLYINDAEASASLDKYYLNQKLKITAEVLGQVAGAFGKQTAAGKAVAIAEATINTYLAASAALTGIKKMNPFAATLAIAQAAAVIAVGLKNVKSIINTQVPGQGGGGSAPTIDSGSVSVAAPLRPTVTQTSTTLPADQLSQIGNAAAGNSEVYVSEGSLTNALQRRNWQARQARIGG